MKQLSATDAARRFSDVLDSVESDGESFVVVRHGRAVATIGPAIAGTGLYARLLSADTGTYAFTVVDAVPASVFPETPS